MSGEFGKLPSPPAIGREAPGLSAWVTLANALRALATAPRAREAAPPRRRPLATAMDRDHGGRATVRFRSRHLANAAFFTVDVSRGPAEGVDRERPHPLTLPGPLNSSCYARLRGTHLLGSRRVFRSSAQVARFGDLASQAPAMSGDEKPPGVAGRATAPWRRCTGPSF